MVNRAWKGELDHAKIYSIFIVFIAKLAVWKSGVFLKDFGRSKLVEKYELIKSGKITLIYPCNYAHAMPFWLIFFGNFHFLFGPPQFSRFFSVFISVHFSSLSFSFQFTFIFTSVTTRELDKSRFPESNLTHIKDRICQSVIQAGSWKLGGGMCIVTRTFADVTASCNLQKK